MEGQEIGRTSTKRGVGGRENTRQPKSSRLWGLPPPKRAAASARHKGGGENPSGSLNGRGRKAPEGNSDPPAHRRQQMPPLSAQPRPPTLTVIFGKRKHGCTSFHATFAALPTNLRGTALVRLRGRGQLSPSWSRPSVAGEGGGRNRGKSNGSWKGESERDSVSMRVAGLMQLMQRSFHNERCQGYFPYKSFFSQVFSSPHEAFIAYEACKCMRDRLESNIEHICP